MGGIILTTLHINNKYTHASIKNTFKHKCTTGTSSFDAFNTYLTLNSSQFLVTWGQDRRGVAMESVEPGGQKQAAKSVNSTSQVLQFFWCFWYSKSCLDFFAQHVWAWGGRTPSAQPDGRCAVCWGHSPTLLTSPWLFGGAWTAVSHRTLLTTSLTTHFAH